MAGIDEGSEFFALPNPNAVTIPARPATLFNGEAFPTGRYKYGLTVSCYFPISFRSETLLGDLIIQNEMASPFGAGWTLDGLHRLHSNEDGTVLVTDGAGTALTFTRIDATTFSPPPGDFSSLTRAVNGVCTRRLKDGTLIRFNMKGQQTSLADRNGNTTTYHYDSAGRLLHLTDPAGLITTFAYGGNGRLATVTDPAGRTTRFDYDAVGNLSRIVEPAGGVRLFAYKPGTHLLASQINQRGFETRYEYDFAGRFAGSISADGSVRSAQPVQTIGLIDPASGEGTAARPAAPPLLITEIRSRTTDARGHSTEFDTDTFGATTSEVDPLGRVTTIVRDAHSNPTRITRPNGAVTTLAYDGRGNLLSLTEQAIAATTIFTYEPAFNQVTTIRDPRFQITTINYDARGNPIEIIDARGTRTLLGYALAGCPGQITSVTNAAGLPEQAITRFEYDPATCNLVRTIDPLGHTNALAYDTAGNVIQSTDAEGRVTRFQYDVMNRLTKVIDATNFDPDPPCGVAGVTCYTYDPRGNLTEVTDARGSVTRFEYDALDRQIATIDPLGRRQTFGYDPNGNLISNTNRRGQVITFDYDAADQLVKKIVQPDTPAEAVTEYRYDLGGSLDRIAALDNALLLTCYELF